MSYKPKCFIRVSPGRPMGDDTQYHPCVDPSRMVTYRITLERMGVDLSKFQSDVTIIPTVYRANFRDPSMMFGAQLFRMRDKDLMYAANSGSVELAKFLGLIRDVSGTALVTGGAVSLIAN